VSGALIVKRLAHSKWPLRAEINRESGRPSEQGFLLIERLVTTLG
jgi:hypothetical protein